MKSNLDHLFQVTLLGESTYLKQITKSFIIDLFHDALMNISTRHERPDFDRVMYTYAEKNFRITTHFECFATPTMTLKFDATLDWEFDNVDEIYSEQTVIAILEPRIEWMGITFKLDDYIDPTQTRKAIVASANGIAVEDWELN